MKEKVRFTEKISYAFCASAYELEVGLTLTYFSLFCTDVAGLSPTLLGIVLLAARCLDGVTDLLITNIADKTHTRFGRYRPWILFMGIPLGIVTMLCYSMPYLTGGFGKGVLWVIILYVVMVPICETGIYCPVMTMGTVMTKDYRHRLSFATARGIGENAGDMIASAVVMTLAILVGGSYKEASGWSVVGIVFGCAVILSAIIGFRGTKERVIADNRDKDGSVLTLKRKLSLLFRNNRPYMKLLGVQLAFMFQWIASMTIFSYFCIYNLQHESWVAILATVGILVQVGVSLLIPKLGMRFEKRTLMMTGLLILILGALILLFANNFFMALAYQLLRGLGNGLMYNVLFSMWADASDYTEWKTGIAIPGIALAIGTLVMKLATALGNYYSAGLLTIGHYDSTLEVQKQGTLDVIRYGFAGAILVGCLVSLLIVFTLKEFSRQNMEKYNTYKIITDSE